MNSFEMWLSGRPRSGGAHVHNRRRRGRETPDAEFPVQKDRGDFGGVEKVGEIVVDLAQLFDLIVELVVGRDQFLVEGLQLFLRGDQFFVRRLQLLIDRHHLFVGRRKLFMHGLKGIAAGLELCSEGSILRFEPRHQHRVGSLVCRSAGQPAYYRPCRILKNNREEPRARIARHHREDGYIHRFRGMVSAEFQGFKLNGILVP